MKPAEAVHHRNTNHLVCEHRLLALKCSDLYALESRPPPPPTKSACLCSLAWKSSGFLFKTTRNEKDLLFTQRQGSVARQEEQTGLTETTSRKSRVQKPTPDLRWPWEKGGSPLNLPMLEHGSIPSRSLVVTFASSCHTWGHSLQEEETKTHGYGAKPQIVPPVNVSISTKTKKLKWVVNSPTNQHGIPKTVLTTTAHMDVTCRSEAQASGA